MTADSITATFATRHDGWTMEKQLAFLEALAASGNVTRAAASVGKSAGSAYRLRGRLGDGDIFSYGWKAALAMAYHRMRELALDRIDHGVAAATVYKGEVVASKTVFSDRLLIAMLDHLKPAEPAPDPRSPADPVRDFAATVEAFDAGIAGGFDPDVPFGNGACPHGCKPHGKRMTREEFLAVIEARPKSVDLERYTSPA